MSEDSTSSVVLRLLERANFIVHPQRYWRPWSGLGKLGNGRLDWQWEALDDDPQFLQRRHLPLPGWHMVELDLDHDQRHALVRLYFDTGSGFSEEESLVVPLRNGRISKRLVYVKGWLKRLRFDPLDSPGRFAVRHFRIVWLTPWFAHDRLSQRLVNMHHRWRNVPRASVIQGCRQRARLERRHWRELALADYEETFEWMCSGQSYPQWLRERGWEEAWERLDEQDTSVSSWPVGPVISPVHRVVARSATLMGEGNLYDLERVDGRAERRDEETVRQQDAHPPLPAREAVKAGEVIYRQNWRTTSRQADFGEIRAGTEGLRGSRARDRSRTRQSKRKAGGARSRDDSRSRQRVMLEHKRSFGRMDIQGESRLVRSQAGPRFSARDVTGAAQAADAHRVCHPTTPQVSILVPVHDPVPAHLRQCLESVLGQDSPHWQLCLVDDASQDPQVIALLEEFAARDNRIELARLEQHGHVCAASNKALSMAKGQYIALLDHDDMLSPCALSYVLEATSLFPAPLLMYSDEDKIDARGYRCEPHFKPGYNPDLLLAQNYIAHLCVFDIELVRQLGGFRPGFEGSQDHDLALRVCAAADPDRVVHIPRVLYHWRASPGSTALCSDAKQYAFDAGLRAVADHLQQARSGAEVEPGPLPHTYRVRWPLPDPLPLVSLLVPTKDRVDLLAPCVEAILSRTRYPNFELLILDNDTRCPETLAYLKTVAAADKRVRVVAWNHPFNYSGINNFGARHARGELLGLLNNDIEPINEDWLDEMVRHAVRPDIGCVGAKLYYPNDTIQHAGVVLGIGGVAGHAHKYFSRHANGYFSRLMLAQNYSAVTGACLLVRKSLFDQVGGLDERHLPVAFNDVDFCLRIRAAGYRNVWTPYAELYHHESESRGADDNASKRARASGEVLYMRSTWKEQLDHDPAYNPNLTLVHEDFSLR